ARRSSVHSQSRGPRDWRRQRGSQRPPDIGRHLTAVHQYGSFEIPHELKPNSDCARRNNGSIAETLDMMLEKHDAPGITARTPRRIPNYEQLMAIAPCFGHQ